MNLAYQRFKSPQAFPEKDPKKFANSLLNNRYHQPSVAKKQT